MYNMLNAIKENYTLIIITKCTLRKYLYL